MKKEILNYSPYSPREISFLYREFLGRLAEQRDEIIGKTPRISWDLGRGGVNPQLDIERSLSYLNSENDQELGPPQREKLHQIKAAVTRMKNGVYGVCDTCRSSIPVDQLRLNPTLVACAGCRISSENEGIPVRLQSFQIETGKLSPFAG